MSPQATLLTHISHILKKTRGSTTYTKQQYRRLANKFAQLLEKERLHLQDDVSTDIAIVFNEVTPVFNSKFPELSPQRIFWEQQQQYNTLNDKRQMRWHPLVIRFALNLKYMSSSAYQAVSQSGIINLPSQRTLSDYTNWSSAHNGIQFESIEKLVSLLTEVQSLECTLAMDEMKIKAGLVFSRRTGRLVGFVDIGNANRDMARLTGADEVRN